MELKAIENRQDRLKLKVLGETHTLLNLITEYSWKAKAGQASYMIRHPYLSDPELTVKSGNPKKTLRDASQLIIDHVREFQQGFKRALRK